MKKVLSSIEIKYLLDEFDVLIGAKVEQIYQIEKDELLIQFHVPNVGKKILRIIVGELIYLTAEKGQVPERPPQFCVYLRKALKQSRLKDIAQLQSERIVSFLFETRNWNARLYVEMINPGNVVLAKEDDTILAVMEHQKWKDRTLKPKVPYVYPRKGHNIFDLSRHDLKEILSNSDKDSLVKALAMDVGIGGLYAEEVCSTAKCDKNQVPSKLDEKDINHVLDSLLNIASRKQHPAIIYDGDTVIDTVPIVVDVYRDHKKKEVGSFNEALDIVFTERSETLFKEQVTKKARTTVGKIHEKIRIQENRVKGLEESAQENQRKGEAIYEHYVEIGEVISEINKAREKLSWKEIKAKLKGHKVIKNIDEKTGDASVEID